MMRNAPVFRTLPPAVGGATRQASVRAGLEALAAHPPAIVLVHDAARPFASPGPDRPRHANGRQDRGCGARPARRRHGQEGRCQGLVEATIARDSLRLIQTPQAFPYPAIAGGPWRAAAAGREDFTDDAALAEWAGMKVACSKASPATSRSPCGGFRARGGHAIRARLATCAPATASTCMPSHRGDHVMLGGVEIRTHAQLTGHSDADVALHALTDAILGALADGDIGAISRPATRNGRAPPPICSCTFAVERVRRAADASRISTSRWSARRRRSARIATPCAPISPRLPASRSTASR